MRLTSAFGMSAALLTAVLFLPSSHAGTRHYGTSTQSRMPCGRQPVECRLVAIRSAVWRVFSNGRAERLNLPGADTVHWAGDVEKGTTGPVPSPDQRFIAYVRAFDVWVYDLATSTAQQVTKWGRPGNDSTAASFVWISGWSPRGTQLLVYVDHEEVEDPEGVHPDLAVQPADFGHYSCDVNRRACSKVALPGTFQGWLADDTYLLTTGDPIPTDRRLVRYDPESHATTRLGSALGWFTQVDLARTSDRALILVLDRAGVDPHGQIFTLDLTTGSLTPVSPLGSFGEYQWAVFSPSARRVAYVKRGPGEQRTIVVDGKLLYQCKSTIVACRPHWITESIIAVQEGTIVLEQGLLQSETLLLTVLDAGTGQLKAVDTLGVYTPDASN